MPFLPILRSDVSVWNNDRPPARDRQNLCGRTEVGPSPPCRTGNFLARQWIYSGIHIGINIWCFHWQWITAFKDIYWFVNFLQEKVWADNFLAGRTTFESRPSCWRAVFVTSVEHCWCFTDCLPSLFKLIFMLNVTHMTLHNNINSEQPYMYSDSKLKSMLKHNFSWIST